MNGRWTILAMVLVGAGLLAAAGCHTEEEYQKALASARMARAELLKSQSALQEAGAENRSLRGDLAAKQREMDDRNAYVASLEAGKLDLVRSFGELHDKYQKLLGGQKPPEFGPIGILLPLKLDAALKALQSQNPDLMEYLPKYGMIKLKADLTFDKGSAEAKPEAQAALNKLAEVMNASEARVFHVYAAGHTDDIPLANRATIDAHGSNWGLSLHRAGAVVKILALAGIDQARLSAMGFSKYHPVAPNAPGNKGNPLNRRVEMWIVPPDRFLTADGGEVAPSPEPEPVPDK